MFSMTCHREMTNTLWCTQIFCSNPFGTIGPNLSFSPFLSSKTTTWKDMSCWSKNLLFSIIIRVCQKVVTTTTAAADGSATPYNLQKCGEIQQNNFGKPQHHKKFKKINGYFCCVVLGHLSQMKTKCNRILGFFY